MRIARVIRWTIVLFWLGMMGWYLRYEAFPGYFTHTLAGYRDLMSEGQLFLDSWMKIELHGKPIGYSHTAVEVADEDPLEHYRIDNRTLLTLNLMGEVQHVSVQSGGSLDMLHKLQRFAFSLNARRYSMRVEGQRQEGSMFRVVTKSDLGSTVQRVHIPDDVILYSPLTEMSLARLKPGEQMQVRTMDPSSLSVGYVQVKALRREPLAFKGLTNQAMVLSVNFRGMELTTWIDDAGRTLRQETPLGWRMEACTADEALALPLGEVDSADLLESAAVRLRGVWPDPLPAEGVRLRLVSAPLEGLSLLASERQQVLVQSNLYAEVQVRAAQWPAAPQPLTNAAAYLGATAFLQADHPEIQARARQLTKGVTGDQAKARALFRWVYEHVRKEPTVSMPSALDVLRRMEGDCNEHTYLFVALARAAGLPAQVRVGLLQKDGAFYYHAWPAVYAGGWVEMDPTVGQELVDAGHLVLLEGEMADQLRLMPVFGRLAIEVAPPGGERSGP